MQPLKTLTVTRDGGRVLRAYDTGGDGLPLLWLHGTPNTGEPPAPLFAAAAELGLRWFGYDRPGYGGSTPVPDRSVASAAADAAAVADALGAQRFAVFGHSGGGMHALACAALLPSRITAAVSVSGLAPWGADGLDWFAGMAPSGQESLRASIAGRAAREHYEATVTEGDPGFIPRDWGALEAEWSWFGPVVNAAMANGPGPMIDDDLAAVAPWGFDPATIGQPVLLVHGEADAMVPAAHSRWLAGHIPGAELRLYPDDGHISVLHHGADAMSWLVASGGTGSRR
jgi:pimeloyl-ACP methyl ester carboxylesterase